MLIDFPTLLAFAATAGAVVLTPGPDTLLILRSAMSSGKSAGISTVCGIQVGLGVHTLLAIFGISFVIASNPYLFKSVAVVGAIYLAWLGVQSLKGNTLDFNIKRKSVGLKRAFVDAMICNLLNPKVIVLFLALFPNFVDPAKGDTALQLLLLSAILLVMNVAWQAPMAFAADRVRDWLSNERVFTAINRGTALILLFFAGLMIWDHVL